MNNISIDNVGIISFVPNISQKKFLKSWVLNEPWQNKAFLLDPGIPGIRSMGPDVTHSLRHAFET